MEASASPPLADLVTTRLREAVITGEFALGEALSESLIARRYGVSRTPVREAFARLGQEGLLRSAPQVGTFVFTMDRENFTQLSVVRSVLEVAALRSALATRRDALVGTWRAVVGVMERSAAAGDRRTYADADGSFHDAMFDLACNPYLQAASRCFHARVAAVRHRLSTTPEHMRKSFAEHVRLLRLAEAGRIDAAAALLDRHIRIKGAHFWPAGGEFGPARAARGGRSPAT
jgi:DNA-binding GntR family transcriptional regulator